MEREGYNHMEREGCKHIEGEGYSTCAAVGIAGGSAGQQCAAAPQLRPCRVVAAAGGKEGE